MPFVGWTGARPTMTCARRIRTAASWRPDGALAGVAALHPLVAADAQDPAQVAVGIETHRGLLVRALLTAG